MLIYEFFIVDNGSINGVDLYIIDWGDGFLLWIGILIFIFGIIYDYFIGLFYLDFIVEDSGFSGCSFLIVIYLVYNGMNLDFGFVNSGNMIICLFDDIDFVIINIDLNMDGMIYYIIINDGIDIIIYI